MKENGQAVRHVVSYFEHERDKADAFSPHLEEIQSHGFNTIVFCISEESLRRPDRLDYVHDAVRLSKESGLFTLADPWSIGKAFGGEGRSAYAESGMLACVCTPEFNTLMKEWVATASALEVDGVFWDEPESHCTDHTDVDIARTYGEYAANYGLFNSVCIPANEKKVWQLDALARIDHVDEIGTDPYYPNVFTRIPKEERNAYVAFWAKEVTGAAEKHGKRSGAWMQGFGIGEGDTAMLFDFKQIFHDTGVDYVGMWGFRGCEATIADLHTEVTKTQSVVPPHEVWSTAKAIFSPKAH